VFLFVFVFGTGLKIFVKVVRVLVSGLGVEIAAWDHGEVKAGKIRVNIHMYSYMVGGG